MQETFVKEKKNPVNLVWIKRDIRTQDHAALEAAEQAQIPYLIVYLFEPSLLAYPDSSLRHQQFIYNSLADAKGLVIAATCAVIFIFVSFSDCP